MANTAYSGTRFSVLSSIKTNSQPRSGEIMYGTAKEVLMCDVAVFAVKKKAP